MKNKLLPLLCLSSFSCLAAETQTLEQCLTIENDLHRLMCYDKVANAIVNPEKTTVTASVTLRTAPDPQADPQAVFGLEHKQENETEEADTLIAIINTVTRAPRGELILTLDNNQVWRQIGADGFRVNAGQVVVISRGAFNSFLLKLQDGNKSIRVKRVS